MNDPHPGLLRAIWNALRLPVAPRYRGYLAFGWVILLLFAVQVVTGVLLSFYYQPAPEMAAETVEFVMRDVAWGWLVRGVHHWSSTLMVALCVLQFVRALVSGSYRRVGGAVWAMGVLLAVAVVGLAYSGDLLTFDAQSYWSITRFLETVQRLPLIGDSMALLIRGDQDIAGSTLSRIYSAHVLILPWLSFFLLVAVIWALSRRWKREGAR